MINVINIMNEFDQKTPYHNKTLGGHCDYTMRLFKKYNYPEHFGLAAFYNNEFLDMCFLINYHMMPLACNTEKIKRRWKERFGEYKYQMLLDFHECDIAR